MTTLETDWELAAAPAAVSTVRDKVRTGPSGVVLGQGESGPVSIRLFAPRPVRVFVDAPDYVPWLLVFRCISMGAHLSIVTDLPGSWQGLVGAVMRSGGTIDLHSSTGSLPGAGRPYRPSLIVDDAEVFEQVQGSLGSWQALLTIGDARGIGAVSTLRKCDLAVVSPVDSKIQDNLRRAYSLTPRQMRNASNLGRGEAVLAATRRLIRVPVPPTPSEYSLLFNE